MPKPTRTCSIVSAFVTFVMSAALAWAQSATLVQAEGRVYSVAGPLSAGASVAFGTEVLTGADGFAIVRLTWPTPAGACVRDTAFGFGVPLKVDRPSGACAPAVRAGDKSTLERLDVGKPDGRGPNDGLPLASLNAFEAVRQGMRPLVLGQNRNAHDFRRIPNVDSAGTCSLQCAMDSQCRAMTYLTDDKTCWMKDETGSPQAGSQATSAVKRVNPLAQTLAPPR